MPNQILSKSQYLTGLQCPKALWLLKNSPHLKKGPSITQQLLFNEGREVEEVARELFPGGVEVKYGEENLKNQIMETQELINGGVKTIYEGTFEYDDIIIKADLLQKGEGGWNLYEIKSSSEISDIQKDDMIYIFTDGFVDQFGGDKGKKYRLKNLLTLLTNISTKALGEQNAILKQEFASWKGSEDQIDDVCVMGVRV